MGTPCLASRRSRLLRRGARACSAIALAAALLLGGAPPADARSEKSVTWELARVFPTAVRFLRIDEGVTIVEKDADAGYVMFELAEEGKTYPGALELVSYEVNGRPALRIIIRIEDRPEYMEVGMLDRLERKLRDELGPPPRVEAKPKPAPKPKPKPGDGEEPPAEQPPATPHASLHGAPDSFVAGPAPTRLL